MGSPGSEERTYILSITIQGGKGFGPDLQAVACAATFAGETKLTPYSVGRDTHVWNATLQWHVTMDQFRRLTSLGQKDCKLVLSNKDGTKLGWFLVDVRAAKLQAQYKKTEGTWVNLTGAKKGDTPQLCMIALFYEDRPGVSFSPEPKQSPGKARAAVASAARRQQAGRNSITATAVDAEPDPDSAGMQATSPKGSAAGTIARTPSMAVGSPPARNPTAGLPNFVSPSLNPADDGPFRKFALTTDVRSFQSMKRLPLSSASVYIRAVLPAELIELVVSSGYRLPSRLAPLCSHPAVDIPRGAEGAIPNGYGTLEFSAGVVQLARVLAREPRISVEAWHKERFRADMLLGAGSVPLTPLLQGAWVDGYAPLFALVTSSEGGEVRVQMGLLRVVLSLEDKGPAPTPGATPTEQVPLIQLVQAGADTGAGAPPANMPAATAATQASGAQPQRTSPYDLDGGANAATATAAIAAGTSSSGLNGAHGSTVAAPSGQEWEGGELSIREIHPSPLMDQVAPTAAPPGSQNEVIMAQRQPPVLPQVYMRAAPPVVSLGSPPALTRIAAAAAAGGASRARAGQPPGIAGAAAGSALNGAGPEFEAAWELEVWKKAEEARWRSELRERETQRMLVLESEWRRRERAREAELASLKAEYLALENKAQQALAAAEGREQRILAAEEALLRRRKELEREHSARMVEAEAAVRRLQVECEHQLDIERDRNVELVRRVAALEERLAASEMRCLTVENEFADFRAATRATPEAELARQLAEAREAAKAAEVRAAKAAKAKQGYKEQVRKLVEQMAALQRRKNHRGSDLDDGSMSLAIPDATGGSVLGSGPTVSAIRVAAEEQARYAASQQQELAAMRAQLQAIKAAALAQLSPPGSPRGQAGAKGRAADGGDAATDIRSSDQQRSVRAEWRSLGSDAGKAASKEPATALNAPRSGGSGLRAAPTMDPDETPTSHHPASLQSNSSNSAVTTPADGSSSSSNGTNGRRLQQPHSRPVSATGEVEAVAAPAPFDDMPTRIQAGAGGPGAGWPARQRWANPRPAASAPPPALAAVLEPGSNEKAASAPVAVRTVSTSTSMTRTTAAAAVMPMAVPLQQQQPMTTQEQHAQQRRGWDRVERQREQVQWERVPARGNREMKDHDDDDHDSRWDDDDGDDDIPQQQRRLASQRGLSGGAPTTMAAAAAGANVGRDTGLDIDVQRRTLADHLASATSAASQLWELQLGQDQGRHSAGQLQPVHGPRPGTTRAVWQVPHQHPRHHYQHQQTTQPNYQKSENANADTEANPEGINGATTEVVAFRPGADLEEVQRLTRRQVELLERGHDPDDPIVVSLDERIQALLAAPSGPPNDG